MRRCSSSVYKLQASYTLERMQLIETIHDDDGDDGCFLIHHQEGKKIPFDTLLNITDKMGSDCEGSIAIVSQVISISAVCNICMSAPALPFDKLVTD